MVGLDKNGLSEQEFLARYDASAYERPAVTADIVLFAVPCSMAGSEGRDMLHGEPCDESRNEPRNCRTLPEQDLELLLIRRGGHPYLGKWALPGGFLGPDETLDQAARRELREETGIDVAANDKGGGIYLEQLHTFSKPGRDPRQWTVTGAYLALADRNKLTLRAGDDAADAAWFKVALTHDDQCDDQQLWHLELAGAGEVLHATLTEAAGAATTTSPKAQPLTATSSDLAFDHADIITYALQRI
jgi:ADP-ribose pyrophosphatase YjhB (NUDIX family)